MKSIQALYLYDLAQSSGTSIPLCVEYYYRKTFPSPALPIYKSEYHQPKFLPYISTALLYSIKLYQSDIEYIENKVAQDPLSHHIKRHYGNDKATQNYIAARNGVIYQTMANRPTCPTGVQKVLQCLSAEELCDLPHDYMKHNQFMIERWLECIK